MAQGPEAGWYDDPEHARKQRYWDGDRWTDARRDPPDHTVAQGPEAGWYDDPEHAGKQRYWDGDRWTDARRDHSPYAPRRTSQTSSVKGPLAAAGGGPGVCPHCGASGVSKARGLQGIEVLIAVVLFFVTFMIGAVVYYVWVESIPYCNSCGHRIRGGALTA